MIADDREFVHSIIDNRELTDEYLCGLLPEQDSMVGGQKLSTVLLEQAYENNRRVFALEIVKRYGAECAAEIVSRVSDDEFDALDEVGLRLMDELSALSGCKYNRASLRENNIMCVMIDELDPAGVEKVHEIERQIVDGTIKFKQLERCDGTMIDLIAKHCSDKIITRLLHDSNFENRWDLSNKLAKLGRYNVCDSYDCDTETLFSDPKIAKWAVEQGKFPRVSFVGLSVNAYILCSQLDGFSNS